MAGRLLPIAIAGIFGIATAMATLEPALKEQQKKKLEEEYKRDMAAWGEARPPTTQEEPLAPRPPEAAPSRLSSALGLWAWNRNEVTTRKESPTDRTPPGSNQ